MTTKTDYWFPAKRYGWGWGLPSRWQGWVVMVAFIGLVAAGSWLFPPAVEPTVYVAYVLALSAVLVLICWRKGEPTRWRWGKD